MQTGSVIWFNDAKGYGFVRDDEDQREVFCHHTEIRNQKGHRTLIEGQRVRFMLGSNERGPCARAVTVIEDGAADTHPVGGLTR